MVRFSVVSVCLVLMPMGFAQLNELAQKAGKKYFGTATDSGELDNSTYFRILTDTREFGQLTPANGQKVPHPLSSSPSSSSSSSVRENIWAANRPTVGIY